MKKRRNIWEYLSRVWMILLLVAFILGAISQGVLALYKANNAYECSLKNTEKITELEKSNGTISKSLEYISKGIDDLKEEQKEMRRDIKRIGGK